LNPTKSENTVNRVTLYTVSREQNHIALGVLFRNETESGFKSEQIEDMLLQRVRDRSDHSAGVQVFEPPL